jgi:hypothetical protein
MMVAGWIRLARLVWPVLTWAEIPRDEHDAQAEAAAAGTAAGGAGGDRTLDKVAHLRDGMRLVIP